jgi:small-conductance mechanosensitive channel
LQISDRRVSFKIHGKKAFKQVLERSDGVLAFPGTNFCFEPGKVVQKLANRHAKPSFRGLPHHSDSSYFRPIGVFIEISRPFFNGDIMVHNLFKSVILFSLIILVVLLTGQTIRAANIGVPGLAKSGNKASEETVQVQEKMDSDQIHSFLATLSDSQVRRLLIQELKEEAAREAAGESAKKKAAGLAGFITAVKSKLTLVRERIQFLQSGASAAPDDLPKVFAQFLEGGGTLDFFKILAGVIAVFAVSLIIDWLFRRYTAKARLRIETTPPTNWRIKMGRLALRSLLDFVSICVFTVATLALLFIFLEKPGGRRLVVITYLAAFLILRIVQMVSRFLLAPAASALRYLPLSDDIALYIHKWVMRLAVVGAFGWLTCGLIRLHRISEASHLFLVAVVGLILALMITVMILQKRQPIAEALRKDSPDFRLRAQIANVWHYIAIFSLFFLWAVWVIDLLLFGTHAEFPAIETLLSIPLFFILDWILQSLLNVAFGIVKAPDDLQGVIKTAASDDQTATAESIADTETEVAEPEEKKIAGRLDIDRINLGLRRGLRILLAAFIFIWLMRMWGIDLPIGRAVARAAFSILVAVLLFYVAWEIINAAIQRRLEKEMPETDEEMEEGGSGGSRVGTLLLLLRKFMLSVLVVMAVLIILSSMGVDIGPLIAGAGVIGLAIGFGAQTLVKDIIAGVFFLIDDAFRVGDYVETAGVKGMVEHISLRSLKLRHHRGMVNTIPFGNMGTVTNFSRDYIITKLDIRVRYDTDVDKVRKIIKGIYQEIEQDEELGPKLLGKIKSQGVKKMDDSAMIMRVKYKTPPGEQFVLRREIYRRIQEAFRENGIEFAHRNVTVYMPPETAKTEPGGQPGQEAETGGTPDQKLTEKAAAAAATAVAQAEADEQKPK